MPSRDEILLDYFDRLLHTPYPLQEEALYAWAAADEGILLSAPTGTGKTLVAEAAVFEGLRTGRQVYYSTPLIALTDQKLLELQDTVERWGYPRDSVGLVTGHRTVNPDAPIKVVVAEVLLNRLLHPEAFALLGALRKKAGFEQLPFGLYLVAVWCVSLLLAEVLYRVVERPGMRLRERFGASRSRDLPPAAAP